MMKYNLLDRLHRRELGDRHRYSSIKGIYGDRKWIDSLDIVNELGGHSGCVNALCWSRSGRLLASGSDDKHLNIHTYQPNSSTDPFSFTATVATGHTANIFSVKFMPHSNDGTLVSCAGDAQVRVFDIEYSGKTTIPSEASIQASDGRGYGPTSTRLEYLYGGVRYINYGCTNTRIYRSHGDRVKRIVTESSPFLFLSCSEDGEVRQWDLRLPSSAYPPPRGGRRAIFYSEVQGSSNVPPPLISYKRYNLDLNTISCSASQPHYIALGGAHLHCFLHDRRMLGRDHAAERGSPERGFPARSMSERDDESMNQATRCVRRFAPYGKAKMRRIDNGHVTACKISDANPNEMVASWSGDHIYSFNLVLSPDARDDNGTRTGDGLATDGRSRVMESRERKRKRRPANVSISAEHSRRRGSRQRRSVPPANRNDLAVRVHYENGQSEDISIETARPHTGNPPIEQVQQAALAEPHKRSLQIAKSVIKIRKLMFSLDTAARASHDISLHAPIFTTVLGVAATCIPDMNDIVRGWHYPINPLGEEVAFHKTLRRHRDATRRFVQAAGTLARILGGRLRTAGSGESPLLKIFNEIRPMPNEGHFEDTGKIFCYDFLRAILLWLDGGSEALIEGFKKSPTIRDQPTRYPIPNEAGQSGIDEYLIPYLLRMARERPVPNVDASRFERDENTELFETETAAVIAFGHAIQMPLLNSTTVLVSLDTSHATLSATNTLEQDKIAALSFWGMRVGRGLLMSTSGDVTFPAVDRAFGGLGFASNEDEGRVHDAVDRMMNETEIYGVSIIGDSVSRNNDVPMGNIAQKARTIKDEYQDTENESQTVENGTSTSGKADSRPSVREGTVSTDRLDPDGDIILANDLHDEIIEHISGIPGGEDGFNEFGNDDDNNYEDDNHDHDDDADYDEEDGGDGKDDDDGDGGTDENDDDDTDITAEERHFVFQSASTRGKLRELVETNVPCTAHSRMYSGHCNVKTVKDVNYFGLQDEYVVSGSDSGHLFIWEKDTQRLVNILEGDGEVVNVIQGHPYEPLLAVSGIDHTIKIFSPDSRAQMDARRGIDMRKNFASSSGTSRLDGWPRSRRQVRNVPSGEELSTAAHSSVETGSELPLNGGLSSRKRMYDSEKIISQNDEDRKAGSRDAYITRDMLAQLAARVSATRLPPGDGEEGEGEGGTVILDENCAIM